MADTVTRFIAGDTANAARDTRVLPGGVPNAIETNIEALGAKASQSIGAPGSDDELLDVTDLVRMFEEAEESTYTARQQAERDRDYYDNKQLTDEEVSTLEKRGQPPVIINRIKRKIDYLVGLEKQQRIDPKALPRTPQHEQDADGATQALRYVAESEDFDNKRSGVWRNMLIEGAGGVGVAVEQDRNGELCIKLRHYAWDRLFYDPHSTRPDFSDAGYLGVVIWMDYNDALVTYPDGQDALDHTLSSAPSETYDDKPKWSLWADKRRKRIRVVQVWIKRGEGWHFAEFTKGGILKSGPSPYQTDQGESDCELIFQSSYVDRDNNRYGVVREMISPQDEINKRRSKALHLLNTAQVFIEENAIPGEAYGGIEGLRKNAAKPDGVIVLPPGGLSGNAFKIETRTDLATAQFQLLQESKNEIDLMGPNGTMMGDKTQGSSAASGKAIIASQQGGMIEMGDLLDHLRHFDKRVFRAVWSRVRQFWNEEKWIRVTDDERNVKWVGMNIDPEKMQQMQMAMQQNPEAAKKVAGMVASVAELDCDIIIDEAPDSVTPALEQWQALTELAKGGIPIPPDVLIESAPNLKNKERLLERMKEAAQGQQGGPDPMQAEMAKVQMETQIAQQRMQNEMQVKQMAIEADVAMNREKLQAEMEMERQKQEAAVEVQREKHGVDMAMARERTQNETNMSLHKMRSEAEERGKLKDVEQGGVAKDVRADLTVLAQATARVQEAVIELAEELKAPIEVVRDPTSGRMAGARRVRANKAA